MCTASIFFFVNCIDREIHLVISKMTDDIKWANRMDGGFVYGHKENIKNVIFCKLRPTSSTNLSSPKIR